MPIHPYSNTNSAQGSEHRLTPTFSSIHRALSPPAPVFHRSSSPQQLIITKSSVNSIL